MTIIRSLHRRASDGVKFIRAGDWWQYKIAPVLGTTYAIAVLLEVPFAVLCPLLLFLLALIVLCAIYVSVVNDICDLEDDLRGGKPNQMQNRSRRFKTAVLCACFVAGLGAAFLLSSYPWTCCLYAANWLVFTLYSVPPVRLKARAAWGVLMVASGEHLLPALWGATLLAEAMKRTLPSTVLAALACWSLALGLRMILWHQLLDQEHDSQAKTDTLVTHTGASRVRRLVTGVIFPLEVGSMFVLLLQINTPWTGPLLMVYGLMEWLRWRCWKVDIVVVEATPNHRLVMTEYYELFYPITFLLALAQREPIVWGWLTLHLLVFFQRTEQFVTQGTQIVRQHWRGLLPVSKRARHQ